MLMLFINIYNSTALNYKYKLYLNDFQAILRSRFFKIQPKPIRLKFKYNKLIEFFKLKIYIYFVFIFDISLSNFD